MIEIRDGLEFLRLSMYAKEGSLLCDAEVSVLSLVYTGDSPRHVPEIPIDLESLDRFVRELEELDRTMEGTARLTSSGDCLRLEIRWVEHFIHLAARGYVRRREPCGHDGSAPASDGATEFLIAFDLSELRPMIREFSSLV